MDIFFFGAFVALFWKDFITFVITLAITLAILYFTPRHGGSQLVGIFMGFLYNKYYTLRCIKEGYNLAGNHTENEMAAAKLKLILNNNNCKTVAITDNNQVTNVI